MFEFFVLFQFIFHIFFNFHFCAHAHCKKQSMRPQVGGSLGGGVGDGAGCRGRGSGTRAEVGTGFLDDISKIARAVGAQQRPAVQVTRAACVAIAAAAETITQAITASAATKAATEAATAQGALNAFAPPPFAAGRVWSPHLQWDRHARNKTRGGGGGSAGAEAEAGAAWGSSDPSSTPFFECKAEAGGAGSAAAGIGSLGGGIGVGAQSDLDASFGGYEGFGSSAGSKRRGPSSSSTTLAPLAPPHHHRAFFRPSEPRARGLLGEYDDKKKIIDVDDEEGAEGEGDRQELDVVLARERILKAAASRTLLEPLKHLNHPLSETLGSPLPLRTRAEPWCVREWDKN